MKFLPVVLLLVIACGDDARPSFTAPDGVTLVDGSSSDGGTGIGVDRCGDMRLNSLIYYGTSEPTAIPLSAGQVMAVGSFNGCSGLFITDEWVLTANHCSVRSGDEFCVGPDGNRPVACFTVDQAVSHPESDTTLVHVSTPASAMVPELEPVAPMEEALDNSWIGRTVEAAGYGQQEDGGFNEREFSAEPLVQLNGPYLVIDGEGSRGVCFGDSGGPVFGQASDGTIRVLGDLSAGDSSCVGRDTFARTDYIIDWIISIVGPITPGTSCGTLNLEGQCVGATAVWCESDARVTESCDLCGWDGSGYRCIDASSDPCEGVSAEGVCVGDVARWCDRGVLRERDCGACGQSCGDVSSVGGAYCVDDPCEGLDYLGECRGDVAVWCEDGELKERDCAASGATCAYVNDSTGYFCVR